MSDSLLSIKNLNFSYGSRKILRDISFEIKPGTVTCLLGPNGCGKTTLIDCILGYLKPESGTIDLQGVSINSLSPKKLARLAAFVPQHHEKHFPFSVSDFILMGRTAHLGMFDHPNEDDRQKVYGLLSRMGRLSMADHDYSELSGGETQMVLIMRALIQESPLIVMDEPTSHLDFKNELLLLDQIEELAGEYGRGVLMSTHSPNQALFLENRGVDINVLLMDENGNIFSGSPKEVLTTENMASIYGIRAVQLSCGDSSCSSLVPLEILKR